MKPCNWIRHLCSVLFILCLAFLATMASAIPAKAQDDHGSSDGTISLPALRPQPGRVIGRVIDSQGQPLNGAEVYVSGKTRELESVSFHIPVVRGTYARALPDGVYGVQAWVVVRFNGMRYTLELEPIDGVDYV